MSLDLEFFKHRDDYIAQCARDGEQDLEDMLRSLGWPLANLVQLGLLQHKEIQSTADLLDVIPTQSGRRFLRHDNRYDVILVRTTQQVPLLEYLGLHMHDPSVIPHGEFCYRVQKTAPEEILVDDEERYGREVRERRAFLDEKKTLCPYWQSTEHGTVRCNFLNKEVPDEYHPDYPDILVKHFGRWEELFDRTGYLFDEIKECGINEDSDGDPN